ncbi:aryl-alcohol dehydrogenase [Fomitopsis serialis]|uniref:aryl-alcohol dehydrogenase n=1 Tax=Fomitopsis serialis TaxID=139415 RepID=UPI00200873CC|nr:aryl-alcohol dehydrogenase [Neoantrodia serialis]KAH9911942.1 aryl-alcohol dehydrogenase [Neoantrodia serialis]
MSLENKSIPYVRLGKSGLKVSKIILGCMSYGSKGWSEWVIDDQEEVTKHIKYAYDHGIQTFDTANVYSNGLSEVMLGKAIRELKLPREELVILTKVYFPLAPKYDMNIFGKNTEDYGVINQKGLNRKHIFDSVRKSLERLQADYIDVLQCHRFDYDTPIEETMQALHDVVQAGYVRYIGMSSLLTRIMFTVHAMQNYAIQNKLTPFVSMQNHHSLVYREEEREMFPTLKMFGVGAIPWSPLGRGILTRPLSAQTKRGETDTFTGAYKTWAGTSDIVTRVEELAGKKGVSMAQVAIAWSLAKDGVTAPIVGTTSLKNLEDIIGAISVELTPDEIKYLEEPYKPLAVYGHV